MRTTLKFTVLALVLAGTGCDKSNKADPLWNQPDYLRGAVPGPGKESTQILDNNNIIISTDEDRFAFVAGTSAQYRIKVRISDKNYTPAVTVANLVDFKHATFTQDQKAPSVNGEQDWIFSWTPDVDSMDTSQTLRVEVGARRPDLAVVQMKPKGIPVEVKALVGAPDVIQANNLPSEVREGSYYARNKKKDITIDVRNVTKTNVAPTLQFLPADIKTWGYVDISPFLKVDKPTQDTTDPHIWHFSLTIDLRSAKTIIPKDTYNPMASFKVAALASQLESSVKSYAMELRPYITAPSSTQETGATFYVKQGTSFKQTIVFFDPTSRGNVSAKVTSTLPSGLNIDCETTTYSSPWMQKCEVNWDVPAKEPLDKHEVDIEATTGSRDPYDQATETWSLWFNIKVVASDAK